MIEAVESSLPEGRLVDITRWMVQAEAEEFIGALKAEIALLIARAARKAMEEPHRVLADPQQLGVVSEELLRKAARLQMCIDVLEEKRHGDEKLISVTLKTI